MSHENFGLLHEAPVAGMELFTYATAKSKAAADARKRAEARREARDRAEAVLESLPEYVEAEAAAAAVKEREALLLEHDTQLQDRRTALKVAKAALKRTEAAREFKRADEDVKLLEETAATQEREATRALAKGEIPLDDRASAAVGVPVVIDKKSAAAGKD